MQEDAILDTSWSTLWVASQVVLKYESAYYIVITIDYM